MSSDPPALSPALRYPTPPLRAWEEIALEFFEATTREYAADLDNWTDPTRLPRKRKKAAPLSCHDIPCPPLRWWPNYFYGKWEQQQDAEDRRTWRRRNRAPGAPIPASRLARLHAAYRPRARRRRSTSG